MSCPLPIIDLTEWRGDSTAKSPSGLTEKEISISREWDEAMKEYGFAIITGHGIELSLFQQLLHEGRQFFELSLVEKMKYNHGHYGHPNGGYTPPGYETVGLSTGDDEREDHSRGESEGKAALIPNIPSTAQSVVNNLLITPVLRGSGEVKPKLKYDPVENFVFTGAPSQFRIVKEEEGKRREIGNPFPISDEYFSRMEGLLHTLHRLSAVALGLSHLDYFNEYYWPESEQMGKNGNCLRITHYPGNDNSILRKNTDSTSFSEEDNDLFDTKVRYGAHTDYQGFTILKPDANDWHELSLSGETIVKFGGLEVFVPKLNQWIQVKIPRHLNALIVNAGDLFQRWTTDRWHSALHRVVHLSIDSSATAANGLKYDNTTHNLSRYSLVFFTGPLAEAMIESIDELGDPTAQQKRYPPIKSHDHLLLKLNRTNSR